MANEVVEIIESVTEVIEIVEKGPKGDQGDGSPWGGITGTLSDQTDLQTELDGKAPSLGVDDNYVTDAEKIDITTNTAKVSRDTPLDVTDLGTLGATLVMDMTGKGYVTFKAATSATALTISITNPPASGNEAEAKVLLDTTTLPSSITFPSGTVDAPTITVGKVWELSFLTDDAGTTWRVIGKEWSA